MWWRRVSRDMGYRANNPRISLTGKFEETQKNMVETNTMIDFSISFPKNLPQKRKDWRSGFVWQALAVKIAGWIPEIMIPAEGLQHLESLSSNNPWGDRPSPSTLTYHDLRTKERKTPRWMVFMAQRPQKKKRSSFKPSRWVLRLCTIHCTPQWPKNIQGSSSDSFQLPKMGIQRHF